MSMITTHNHHDAAIWLCWFKLVVSLVDKWVKRSFEAWFAKCVTRVMSKCINLNYIRFLNLFSLQVWNHAIFWQFGIRTKNLLTFINHTHQPNFQYLFFLWDSNTIYTFFFWKSVLLSRRIKSANLKYTHLIILINNPLNINKRIFERY
jgi:hypothetical protein